MGWKKKLVGILLSEPKLYNLWFPVTGMIIAHYFSWLWLIGYSSPNKYLSDLFRVLAPSHLEEKKYCNYPCRLLITQQHLATRDVNILDSPPNNMRCVSQSQLWPSPFHKCPGSIPAPAHICMSSLSSLPAFQSNYCPNQINQICHLNAKHSKQV